MSQGATSAKPGDIVAGRGAGSAVDSAPAPGAVHVEAQLPPASVNNEHEIERLIAALHQHVEDGISPQTLRSLTDELERRTRAERRCVELLASEQLARAEARESQEANQSKDRFLAMLSHELRTPLQPVIGAATALLRDPRIPADLLDEIRMIQRNVQLEARLIDDLLDLTRVAGGKLTLERQRVNVDSVIARAVDICEPDAIAKKLTLSVRRCATRTWLNADPGRLQQVLWNLIKNAVKFTPEGGEIVVETADSDPSAPERRVIIRVSDNGIGIESSALPRIFDAFEQGSSEVTRRYGGMGLGLAICKLLVERHDGALIAHSEGADRGATFTLSLPTVDAPAPAAAGPRGVYKADDGKRRVRILLVEDDADSRFIMAKLLKSLGHEVTTACDCASALTTAASGNFELLLCDLRLPDGSGLDVMTKLAPTRLRGIALTGYGSDRDIALSHAAGFDAHLTKPVALEHISQAIAKLFPA